MEAVADIETETETQGKTHHWPDTVCNPVFDYTFYRGLEIKNDGSYSLVICKNDDFFRLLMDGTEKYLGRHRCNSWEIRSHKIVFQRKAKYFKPHQVGSFCLHDNGWEEPLS